MTGLRPFTALPAATVAFLESLLAAVGHPRQRLMLRLAYGCGLRLGEVMRLRVADLDSARGLLWVRRNSQKFLAEKEVRDADCDEQNKRL